TYVTSQQTATATSVAAGGSYTVNKTVSIPVTKTGQRYLLFVTDWSNQVTELDETNNVKALPITLTGADLAVTAATAPATAAIGSQVQVSYTVSNLGNGDAASP